VLRGAGAGNDHRHGDGSHPQLEICHRGHRRGHCRACRRHVSSRLRPDHLATEIRTQLAIGALLLIFGLQWLRKAILRSAGRKAAHDEDHIYRKQVAAAHAAAPAAAGLDMFSFIVSFKGVFLEGIEVVFIVITFGVNAHDIPVAVLGAAGAVIIVLAIAAAARRPLSMIPENLLKYGVGLLLASFGTFWVVEGVGIFRAGHSSLQWPGNEAAILGLLAAWLLVSRIFVASLDVSRAPAKQTRLLDPTAREEVNA
jgi:uncharacterized membrane protein